MFILDLTALKGGMFVLFPSLLQPQLSTLTEHLDDRIVRPLIVKCGASMILVLRNAISIVAGENK